MAPLSPLVCALTDRLDRPGTVVEIGIGHQPGIAAALAGRGYDLIATDVHPVSVPSTIRFVRDDAFDPDLSIYRGAEALYALNCPPDLHGSIRAIARTVGTPFYFTTLGADPPAIPAETASVPGDPGETLFIAHCRGSNEFGEVGPTATGSERER